MYHSSNPTLFGRPNGVLVEAEALKTTVAGLRRVSDSLQTSGIEVPVEARRLLANFATNLSVYFDAKEAAAYFGVMVAECPDLEENVATLGEARANLKTSVKTVRKLAFTGEDMAQLGRSIHEVVDGFEQHEHAELDLLQLFFTRSQALAANRPEAS